MLAAILYAVFLTNHVIVVLIRFTVCGTTATVYACFGVFARNIVFAVFVCAAVCNRTLGIDTCIVTAYESRRFAS